MTNELAHAKVLSGNPDHIHAAQRDKIRLQPDTVSLKQPPAQYYLSKLEQHLNKINKTWTTNNCPISLHAE